MIPRNYFQGYLVLVNKQVYCNTLSPDCIETYLTNLMTGLDYKIKLVALTEHAVGKQILSTKLDETGSDFDSIYNSGDEISVDSNVDGLVMNSWKFKNDLQNTRSTDSGQNTLSPVLPDSKDCQDIVKLISSVKKARNSQNVLERYPSCKAGPSVMLNYNNFVAPPNFLDVVDVLGESAQLAWNFSLPNSIDNSRGVILVRPEVFKITYWKHGEEKSNAKCRETKGGSVCCYIR